MLREPPAGWCVWFVALGLLLLALALEVLPGAKGQRAADEDDGVQTDAGGGAVRGGGG